MARRSGKETAPSPRQEDDQEQEKTPEPMSKPAGEKKTLKLRLLRNAFVRGAFGKKGKEYTFPREEAERRLKRTDGIWEAVGNA